MKDILENIGKTPYKVPEGYFETFAEKVRPWEQKHEKPLRKVTPYLSMAAMFAIIVAAGTLMMRFMQPADDLQEYGSHFYCDLIPNTETVCYSYGEETYTLSEDDIIEYLIYNGTNTDDLEDLQ